MMLVRQAEIFINTVALSTGRDRDRWVLSAEKREKKPSEMRGPSTDLWDNCYLGHVFTALHGISSIHEICTMTSHINESNNFLNFFLQLYLQEKQYSEYAALLNFSAINKPTILAKIKVAYTKKIISPYVDGRTLKVNSGVMLMKSLMRA